MVLDPIWLSKLSEEIYALGAVVVAVFFVAHQIQQGWKKMKRRRPKVSRVDLKGNH